MKKRFFVVALALVLLAGAVAVGVHVFNREARADTSLYVKFIPEWEIDEVDWYDVQGTVELLNANNQVTASKELWADGTLTSFSNTFYNPPSTSVRARISWDTDIYEWIAFAPPIVVDLDWPELPDIIEGSTCLRPPE